MDGDIKRKYNLKSPAVKRLMREAMELRETTEQYFAQPLEDNLFEWHFTVRGPADSEFENGCYHGRIILPPEYPMKPPSIMLLTPNGRFETGKKICLSMSAHHPETWQPSWSIRTVLLAIIGFMPTKGGGAIGALDYTHKERKALANKSLEWKCDVCAVPNKTALLVVDHSKDEQVKKEAQEIAAQMSFKGEPEKGKPDQTSNQQPVGQSQTLPQNSSVSDHLSYNGDPNNAQSPPNVNPYLYNPYFPNMYNAPQVVPPGTPPNVTANFPSQDNGSNSQATGTNSNHVEPNAKSNDENVVASSEGNASAAVNKQTKEATGSGLRQRQPNVSSENASSNVSSSTGRVRQVAQQTDPGYCSLILLWIVAAALVVLVLRRLCMDTIKIPQG